MAFVGATGAGKTSLINLLTRLYEPQRGSGSAGPTGPPPEIPQKRGCGNAWRRSSRTSSCSAAASPRTYPAGSGCDLGVADVEEAAARTVEAHTFIETRLPAGYQHRAPGTRCRPVGRPAPAVVFCPGRGSRLRCPRCWTRRPARSTPKPRPLIQRGIHNLMEGKTAHRHRPPALDHSRTWTGSTSFHKGRIVEESGQPPTDRRCFWRASTTASTSLQYRSEAGPAPIAAG